MKLQTLIDDYDLFLFDMDGTLMLGDQALGGAVALLKALRDANKTIYFVTNNTLYPTSRYSDKLNKAGITANDIEILTPLAGLIHHVSKHDIKNPFVIASDAVKKELPSSDGAHDAVILGLCQNWDYEQLQTACNLIKTHDLPVILCQPDPYCPAPFGNIPDSGALMALIETTLVRTLDPIVIGKPNKAFLDPVFANNNIERSRAVLFGDRLHTDMALADACDIKGALVLTGQTKHTDVTTDMNYIVLDDLNSL